MNYHHHRNYQWEGSGLPQNFGVESSCWKPFLLSICAHMRIHTNTHLFLTYTPNILLGWICLSFHHHLSIFFFFFFFFKWTSFSLRFVFISTLPQSAMFCLCGLNSKLIWAAPPPLSSPDSWREPWPLWWTQPGWGSLWRLRCCPGSDGYSPSSPAPQYTAPCCPRGLKNNTQSQYRQ